MAPSIQSFFEPPRTSSATSAEKWEANGDSMPRHDAMAPEKCRKKLPSSDGPGKFMNIYIYMNILICMNIKIGQTFVETSMSTWRAQTNPVTEKNAEIWRIVGDSWSMLS